MEEERSQKETIDELVKKPKRLIITGTLGFIGCNLVSSLAGQDVEIIGLDLKRDNPMSLARQTQLASNSLFSQRFCDVTDSKRVMVEFQRFRPDAVVHLAAEAGVRTSIESPSKTTSVNLQGFANVLEASQVSQVEHFVYASSSSVYGNASKLQSSELDPLSPQSLYAATKVANEAMAQAYSNMYGLTTTGLRIFTAYGPFGRPDMAIFKFTEKILRGDTIEVFNGGRHSRDFTFIDDVITDILSILGLREDIGTIRKDGSYETSGNSEIFNLGTGETTSLPRLLEMLETATGRRAKLNMVGPMTGDVTNTHADTSKLDQLAGYRSRVQLEEGVEIFMRWHKKHFSEQW